MYRYAAGRADRGRKTDGGGAVQKIISRQAPEHFRQFFVTQGVDGD